MTETSATPYLHDTWGFTKYAGTWCFEAPSLQEPGGYLVGLSTLDKALQGIGRISQVEIESPDPTPTPLNRLVEAPPDSALTLDDVRSLVEGFEGEISLVAVLIDLFAYVRTEENGEPRRMWVREPTEITLWGGRRELQSRPRVCLSMEHTLFQASSRQGDDNRELYWKNRPILSELLDRLQSHFGPMSGREGDVEPTGYPAPTDDESDT